MQKRVMLGYFFFVKQQDEYVWRAKKQNAQRFSAYFSVLGVASSIRAAGVNLALIYIRRRVTISHINSQQFMGPIWNFNYNQVWSFAHLMYVNWIACYRHWGSLQITHIQWALVFLQTEYTLYICRKRLYVNHLKQIDVSSDQRNSHVTRTMEKNEFFF